MEFDKSLESQNGFRANSISAFRESVTFRPDFGIGLSRKEKVHLRRVVFRWLPLHFHNDLVAGSWYFVFGSIIFTLISIIPLIDEKLFPSSSGNLTSEEIIALSSLLVVSGIFFTLGSGAFVRALREEDKLKPPVFNCFHCSTDELLAAWLYFFAMVPYPLSAAVYIYNEPSSGEYWIAFIATSLAALAFYLFVLACYPRDSDDKDRKECSRCIPACVLCFCGENSMFLKHVENDWLLGCWIFYLGSLFLTLLFLLAFIHAIRHNDSFSGFWYFLYFFDMIAFTVGCAYFLAGSYSTNKTLTSSLSKGGHMSSNEQTTPLGLAMEGRL